MRNLFCPALTLWLAVAFLVGCDSVNEGSAAADPVRNQLNVGKGENDKKPSSDVDSTAIGAEEADLFAVSTGSKFDSSVGRLAKELFRQTVLLIAAEDFGLSIQDESFPKSAPRSGATIIRFDTSGCGRGRIPKDKKLHWIAKISQRSDPNDPDSAERIFFEEIPEGKNPRHIGPYGEHMGPVKFVDLSDTAQVYQDMTPRIIAALEECGFDAVDQAGVPELSEADKASIDEITLRLREMTFISQFEAIRAAHDLTPTPAKHRLLAYGYANLGLLTQHHLSANHKIFFARSLVHAERACRKDPGDASLAARAYSRALTGLHASALECLKARTSDPTPRLEVIDAFCRFRQEELLSLGEAHPEVSQLATLLALIVVEASRDEDSYLEVYEAALKVNPRCFRIYDCAVSAGQIGLMHDLTARAPAQLMRGLPKRLGAVTDLPQPVQNALDGGPVLPSELADAMRSVEDDDAEQGISWRLLGTLVRDEALVQAQRRMYLLKALLNVSTAAARDKLAKFVGEHELLVLALEPYADEPDWNRIQKAAENYLGERTAPSVNRAKFSDMGPQFERLLRDVLNQGIRNRTSNALFFGMRGSSDWIARDIVLIRRLNSVLVPKGLTDTGAPLDALATLSPHHPARFFREMHRDDVSPDRLRELEQQLASRPVLLGSLASAMMEHGLSEDAIRVAARMTELSPSHNSFRRLAKLYYENGDVENYIRFLKKAVEYPSPSLSPARSRVSIANYYMGQGNYQAAEPFAAAAAESYAAWAMYCAIDCYTGLEEYDLAEQWHIRRIKRYGHTPDLWFTWCIATGRGDIRTAQSLVEARIAPYREKSMAEMTVHEALSLAGYYAVKGNDAAAADLRAHIARRDKNPAGGLHAALLYLRAGEREEAIALLRESVGWTESSKEAPGAARRAGIFLDSLESGQPLEQGVMEQLDRDIDTYAKREWLLFHALYGELFFFTGNPEQGLDFLRQAIAFPLVYTGSYANYDRAFASVWLRERLGIPPDQPIRLPNRSPPVAAPKP